MSSPACADGNDTPAQQREDSTTFMDSESTIAAPAEGRTRDHMREAKAGPDYAGPS